tara:strand:+ start:532 stop:774 length:243 start_codon:yes stop_codon:yes gene_type:complete
MIAMVGRINEDKINESSKFRGKFKNQSFCKWLKFNRKKYIIEDDCDSDNSNDYDKGEFINGNKPVVQKYRRPGLFKLFKT